MPRHAFLSDSYTSDRGVGFRVWLLASYNTLLPPTSDITSEFSYEKFEHRSFRLPGSKDEINLIICSEVPKFTSSNSGPGKTTAIKRIPVRGAIASFSASWRPN